MLLNAGAFPQLLVHSAESFKREQNKTTTTKTKKSKYFLILTLSNLCIMKSVLSSPHKIISHDTILYTFLFSIRVFAHEHSDNYLQLCTWDDYHIFLIAPAVFTRPLLDEIYHCIELLFDWLMWCWLSFCLLVDLILDFVTAIWHEKPVGLVFASTIILVLQANQLIKCASHPNVKYIQNEHVFYITYIQNEHRI